MSEDDPRPSENAYVGTRRSTLNAVVGLIALGWLAVAVLVARRYPHLG